MITIDQRGCGLGKTTGLNNSIYTRINLNLSNKHKTLIAVPSKELQYKYLQDWPHAIIVNSDLGSDTTSKQITYHMNNNEKLIICTHAALTRLHETGLRSYYHLIIDEDIGDIIKHNFVDFSGDKELARIHWENRYSPTLDTKAIFDVLGIADESNQWYEMNVLESELNSIINESESYREIMDPNYKHYMRYVDYNNMLDRKNTMNFMSVLSTAILRDWMSIHIASAAFEQTKMYYWLKTNNIEVSFINKFIPHKGNINIYSSHDPYFHWSKSKIEQHPELIVSYHDEVNKWSTGEVISLRNNNVKNKLGMEIRLNHNVHGINSPKLQSITNISCESALIPSPLRYNFMVQYFELDDKDRKTKQIIRHMHMYHLFYQVIMRCKLRDPNYNNEPINIFCPDQDIAVGLQYYFDITDIKQFDFTSKIIGSCLSPAELHAERVRRYRSKDKVEKKPMTNAERVAKHRAKKRAMEGTSNKQDM